MHTHHIALITTPLHHHHHPSNTPKTITQQARDATTGATPLLLSAERGDDGVARILLDRGASVRAVDNNQQVIDFGVWRGVWNVCFGVLEGRGGGDWMCTCVCRGG